MLEGVKKMGQPTPSLDNRPELHDDLTFVMELFHILHVTRSSSGFGPNTVSTTSMESVLRLYEIHDIDERLWYMHLFIALDQTYLTIESDKTSQKRKSFKK